MCGGGGSSGPSAAEMEAERQQKIDQGMANINGTFDQFDNSYYDNIRGAYMDYVQPDFDKQYADARRNLAMALARQGISSSSMAADKQGDLQDLNNKNALALQQKADGYVNDRRSSVENSRSAVVGQLNASANAGQAGQQALSQASTLQSLPEFSPMGQLFGTALDGLRYQMGAEQNNMATYNTGLFAPSNGSGASKVVS